MPTAPTQAQLYEIARRALPRFLFQIARVRETLWGAAGMFAAAGAFIDERADQTLIGQAGAPWLAAHARDRASYLQSSESVENARLRLRSITDVATKPALQAAVDAQLASLGTGYVCKIVELALDGSFAGQSYTGQGFRAGTILPLKIIVILPYGTTVAVENSVRERLRKLHAAGIVVEIETRQIP